MDITAWITGATAEEGYRLYAAFQHWPTYSPAIRAVRVTAPDEGRTVSRWEAGFHEGVLCWSEEDDLDPAACGGRFRQVEGDLEHFAGSWSFSPHDGGCRFHFRAEFDLGIPSLNDVLEPIAEQALYDNLSSVLTGLFGAVVLEVAGGVAV
jgi:ribosome-associated toxin RatA of RatAB toxin-antitoxin module